MVFVVVPMRMSPRGSGLNAWSPVGGGVWEGLGGKTLLEETCGWGGAARSASSPPLLLCAVIKDVTPQLPALAAVPRSPQWTPIPLEEDALGHGVLSQ